MIPVHFVGNDDRGRCLLRAAELSQVPAVGEHVELLDRALGVVTEVHWVIPSETGTAVTARVELAIVCLVDDEEGLSG